MNSTTAPVLEAPEHGPDCGAERGCICSIGNPEMSSCACPNMHGRDIYCPLPADDELYILEPGMNLPEVVVPACGFCSAQTCAL